MVLPDKCTFGSVLDCMMVFRLTMKLNLTNGMASFGSVQVGIMALGMQTMIHSTIGIDITGTIATVMGSMTDSMTAARIKAAATPDPAQRLKAAAAVARSKAAATPDLAQRLRAAAVVAHSKAAATPDLAQRLKAAAVVARIKAAATPDLAQRLKAAAAVARSKAAATPDKSRTHFDSERNTNFCVAFGIEPTTNGL